MPAPVLQPRVAQDVIDRELAGQPTAQAAADGPVNLPVGEPSPGAICATPSFWQRDTRAYGLRQLPLCTGCAAALQGQVYKREIPESTSHAVRRGTA